MRVNYTRERESSGGLAVAAALTLEEAEVAVTGALDGEVGGAGGHGGRCPLTQLRLRKVREGG